MQTTLHRRRLCLRRVVASSFGEVHNRRRTSSVAAEALDQLSTGVIVTDRGAGVVEINRAAESIVQLEDGLLIRDDRLCARRAFGTGKVIKLIAGATVEDKSAVAAGRMLIGRSDGLPAYALSVAPLRTGLAVDNRRFAMIVVVDPIRHCPSEKDLAEFFGLTPAEARVAKTLVTGKTLAEIAADSGIRITTVRTQLASILRKVGAKRQADLIRVLSNIGLGSVSWAAGWIDVALEALQIPRLLAGV